MAKRGYIFCLLVVFLAGVANAENVTVSESTADNVTGKLNDINQQAKSINEQIKSLVPYEIWEFATIGLLIFLSFARGSNQAYGGIWKIGIYVAIIAVAAWFILTR